jgi:ATP-dependent DNA helicase RecQ
MTVDLIDATDALESHLKKWFGYNHFRPYQIEIIQAILEGKDVLAILPTGAGKSLCYQLPALISEGTALVVSPLIALMQDQVVSLYKNGISAAFINSSLPNREIQEVMQHMNDYRLIYVAPERLVDPQFLERLKTVSISFFVIDEAHCISQWGHSFRSEYRQLSLLKKHFPTCPIMALTATATQDVEKDIQVQLAMQQPVLIKGSFERSNLTIRVQAKTKVEKQLQDFLDQQGSQSGIIYAATRKGVETTYAYLRAQGMAVERYHAGMTDQERSLSQHAFLHDDVPLMVATVAFGMGIHKPDIRFIIHLDMPRTIEQYYQEIGRAGRDGLPADCLMLYSMQDLFIYKRFLEEIEDLKIQQQIKTKTNQMMRFCQSTDCRRKELLRYFGEIAISKHCHTCDNCLDEVEQVDATITAQKILSCVYRLKQNLGIRTVIEVLRGAKSQAIQQNGFDQLSTYGILSHLSEIEVRYSIDSLLYQELLGVTEGQYPVLKWTPKTALVIKNQQKVYFKKRSFKTPKVQERLKAKEQATLHYDEGLYETLKQLRQTKAKQEKVPAYVVFSDRALQEMAVYYPKNQQEFIKINGVGPIKWIKYGEEFLQLIQSHQSTKALPLSQTAGNERSSKEETVYLYQQGFSLEQIMHARQLVKSTILVHLIESIQEGSNLDITRLVTPSKQLAIQEIIVKVGVDRLTPIKELLTDEYSYDEIRLVAAFQRQLLKN